MRTMNRRLPLDGLAVVVGVWLVTGPITSPARSQAQGRPPIAIVGARIIDGSGNEPFTGTIVLSGGRITAVGRQVEPPADAERIDGSGRAVLPGFIETSLRLTSDGLTSDAARRRLGRALAAGVTTAAIDGAMVTPSTIDGTQPRLLQPAALEGEPPANLPAGTRAMRNGTVAIVLEGDAAAAVSALKAAKARVAIGGLVEDDGSVTPARVAAAALSPLEAVTAMTSGGAWALGLQSDRGLLAPGMRADLVVVTGDPAERLEAVSQVERVFLGGMAVDRAALLAAPPAPPPPTPQPTAAEAAAPTAAPRTPTTPARRRGRAARTSPAAAKTPTPPASEPALASPPSASAETPASTPAPTPAPVPAAKLDPKPEPKPDLEAAPAPAVPPPAPEAPPRTPTPKAEAPAASGVAPAAAPIVGARLRDPLLDDFERGEAASAVGPAWVGSASEGGGSPTTLIMGRVVKGLRDHALLVSARMGGGREPFARAALKLDAEARPVDVSRYRGLRFDARGEGRYRVVFVTRSVADGRYHASYFSGSPLWTPVNIPFASVGQTGEGTRVPWTGRDVVEIRFEMDRAAGKLGWLELDNVTFY
jgi:hypothetical protein